MLNKLTQTKQGEEMKKRTLDIVKNKKEYLTYDVIYKGKYKLAKIAKEEYEWDNKRYSKYAIKVIKESIGRDYETFDQENKRYVAFDRSLEIVKNSIIDLMKEEKNIRRLERA
jgi:hypothetical protein